MDHAAAFGVAVLLSGVVLLLSVLSNRITAAIRVPVPLLVLVGSAAVVALPQVQVAPEQTVEDVVSIALALILFDGGMHLGLSRLRGVLATIVTVGVVGTFATTLGVAVFAHFALGLGWFAAMLVATAVAPTDPAVVFSVLGQHQGMGRSGTILEGESGANDPVGISLMVSLLAAGVVSWDAAGQVALGFAQQMGIGAVVGVLGGTAVSWFASRVALPAATLYPLRSLAGCLIVFGAAAALGGSGFLAVFIAGIVLADRSTPHRAEVEGFHATLAGLAEIVAFVALGATISVSRALQPDVLVAGLALAVVLTVVIRPVLVGLCLLPASLRSNERGFILFAGLKGAVPILLAEMIRIADVPDAERLYGIVVVVVVFSVLVQGTLLPTVASRLGVTTR